MVAIPFFFPKADSSWRASRGDLASATAISLAEPPHFLISTAAGVNEPHVQEGLPGVGAQEAKELVPPGVRAGSGA